MAVVQVKLPPLIRKFGTDPNLLQTRVEAAIRATHNMDDVVEYGRQCVEAFLKLSETPTGADDAQMNCMVSVIPVIVRYAGFVHGSNTLNWLNRIN